MRNIVLGMILLFVTLSAQAQEKKNKNAKHEFEVNGNCEQCKKRIQKAAFSVAGVKSATWNIESHQMTVIINEEKCSLIDVKTAIAKVGHDSEEVKTTDEVYAKLNSCCQYERK